MHNIELMNQSENLYIFFLIFSFLLQQLGGQSPGQLQQPLTPVSNGCKRPKNEFGQTKITDDFKVTKKPRSSGSAAKRSSNRFNGMSEEEVAKRGLPDYIKPGLDIVFIGINPSMFAAYTGKYYDGPGNHFWQALYLSGILSEPMSAVDDHKLLDLGIGFTNIVPRTTRGLSDLSRKEIADGAEVIILAQHDMNLSPGPIACLLCLHTRSPCAAAAGHFFDPDRVSKYFTRLRSLAMAA